MKVDEFETGFEPVYAPSVRPAASPPAQPTLQQQKAALEQQFVFSEVRKKINALLSDTFSPEFPTGPSALPKDPMAIAEALRFDALDDAPLSIFATFKSAPLFDLRGEHEYLAAIPVGIDLWNIYECRESSGENVVVPPRELQTEISSRSMLNILWSWEKGRENHGFPQGNHHYSVKAKSMGAIPDEHGVPHLPHADLPEGQRFSRHDLAFRHAARQNIAENGGLTVYDPVNPRVFEDTLTAAFLCSFSERDRHLRKRYMVFKASIRETDGAHRFLCNLHRLENDPEGLSLLHKDFLELALSNGMFGQNSLPYGEIERLCAKSPQFADEFCGAMYDYLRLRPRSFGGGHVQKLCTMAAALKPFPILGRCVDDAYCLKLIACVAKDMPNVPSFAFMVQAAMDDSKQADDLIAFCKWKDLDARDNPRRYMSGGVTEYI